MAFRSSAALACREERGRSGRAAAKRAGGMGVVVADIGGGCVYVKQVLWVGELMVAGAVCGACFGVLE